MRPDANRYFMDMARLVAARSTCVRRSVGCVLVDSRRHVIATGYNGVPSGDAHCNDVVVKAGAMTLPHACSSAYAKSGTELGACRAIHAEQNALLQCRDVYAIDKAYVTTFPCETCVKLLLNTSCHEIVYDQNYAGDGVMTWIRAGRVARQFDGEPPMLQRDLVAMFRDDLDEWRVAVACVCLNVCSARAARSVVTRILVKWATPDALSRANDELERMLRPLGLAERRAKTLRHISSVWGTIDIHAIAGLGPYAVESIMVFCRNVIPQQIADSKVAAWVEWRRLHDTASALRERNRQVGIELSKMLDSRDIDARIYSACMSMLADLTEENEMGIPPEDSVDNVVDKLIALALEQGACANRNCD